MSTFGHPGRYTYCIGENEEASPWPPYHAERGVEPGTSAVTLFAGEAPHGISDHSSRAARALAGSLGWSMAGLWNSNCGSKADLRRHLCETIRRPYGELLPDDDHGEGTNLRYGKTPPAPDAMVPKFPSIDELHVLVAGGTAGRFSMAIPGWLGTKNGSRPVTRVVESD